MAFIFTNTDDTPYVENAVVGQSLNWVTGALVPRGRNLLFRIPRGVNLRQLYLRVQDVHLEERVFDIFNWAFEDAAYDYYRAGTSGVGAGMLRIDAYERPHEYFTKFYGELAGRACLLYTSPSPRDS